MAIQYKPTKQKKEKPQKTPKAPKAEKAVKLGGAKAVKIDKPKKVKAPKAPKAPKPEKAVAFKPGKVEKAENLSKQNVLKKSVNPKVAVIIVVALVIVAVVAVVVIVPAMNRFGQEIKGIEIDEAPAKVEYLQGEEADYSGLRVKVIRNNGDSFIVRASDCKISGFDSNTPMEAQMIKVEYEGFTALFSVKIIEFKKPKPTLDFIELDPVPTKTEYKVDEWLDTNGGVLVVHYKDGSSVRLNLKLTDVYGWYDVDGPGTYTLTVKYAENGVLATTTYDITVTE